MTLPLEKTLLGMITDLSSVIVDCKYLAPKKNGGYESAAEGFYFLSSKDERVKSFAPKYSHSLYVKLDADLDKKVKSFCSEGLIGSFSLIPWKHYGVALLLATDRNFIGGTWIGFIPLDKIPNIEYGKLTQF